MSFRARAKLIEMITEKKGIATSTLEALTLPQLHSLAEKVLGKEAYRSGSSRRRSADRKRLPACITRSKVPLKEYQYSVVEWMKVNRGAAVCFGGGSGKTLTGVAATQCFLDAVPNGVVIVVTPTSLVENFRDEMRKYGADPDDPRYTFFTFTTFANKFKSTMNQFPRNSFLLVDEAHNLRTNIERPDPEKMKRPEIFVKCAKRASKVMLLTFTPVYNEPYDIVNLVAMVKGEAPLTRAKFDRLLSDSHAFDQYFGCIFSFYDVKESEKKNYPQLREHTVHIEMTPEFYRQYRDVELKEEKIFNITNPFIFLVGMRQATNALQPQQKIDWTVAKIQECVAKNQKVIVYSAFKTAGVDMLRERLETLGISHREITGEIPRKSREKVRDMYNSDEIQVLMITKAGSEGLHLIGTRVVIHLEAGWNRDGEKQTNMRAARQHSHSHLPPEDRFVDVYYLLIEKPRRRDPTDKRESADEILKEKVISKDEYNQSFLKKLYYSSIEMCRRRAGV